MFPLPKIQRKNSYRDFRTSGQLLPVFLRKDAKVVALRFLASYARRASILQPEEAG